MSFSRRSPLLLLLLALMAFAATAQVEETDDDPVAIFNVGQELHERGRLVEAIEQYSKAIELVPEFPEAEYQRGAALMSLGRNDEAERAFRRAIELRPEWTLSLTSLASLLVPKVPAEAEHMLEKVIKAEPQNSLALSALTELRLNAKAPRAALIPLLDQITSLTEGKVNPTASLWGARAALESALGLKAESRRSLASALAIDPKNRSVLSQAAEFALADGDLLKAKELADRLRGAGGDTVRVKYLGAAIMATEGKTTEALKALSEIPDDRAAIELKLRLKASSASPADLEKLLETDPQNVSLLARLCVSYRRDQPQKALDYCRRASAAEPDNVNHAVGFGAALVQAKQFEAAATLLKRIVTIAPDHATAHANLGSALFQLKRWAEAKVEFRWLTEKQPKEATAYYLLGISHDQLGEYLDALANYQQYVRLADPVRDVTDIEKVKLRLPQVEKLIKEGKGKR